MSDFRLQPSTADGFSALDVELAMLLRRLLPADGPWDWWCAALALTSRAHADGHTALRRSLIEEPNGRTTALSPADPSQSAALQSFWAKWHAAAANHPEMPAEVVATGLLVQEGAHLQMTRLWAAERRVAQALARRIQQPDDEWPARADEQILQWLPSSPSMPSGDQQAACRQGLRGALSVITGGPGTGKTHTAARLIALFQKLRPPGAPLWRIGLAAPTGKAAARLRQALESAWEGLAQQEPHEASSFWAPTWEALSSPRTVHAWLSDWRQRRRQASASAGGLNVQEEARLPLDLLLVDEASMLDLQLLDDLLQALPARARLVLIGDRDQLSSVEAGAVMADICEVLEGRPSLVPLRHSRRFHDEIGRWALGVRDGDSAVLQGLAERITPDLSQLVHQSLGPDGWSTAYAQLVELRDRAFPPNDAVLAEILAGLDRFRILAAVRHGEWGVEALNHRIRQELLRRGWMEPHGAWPHGQLLMVTRNDESTGLRNGDVGVVIRPPDEGPAQFVWKAGQSVRRVGTARLPPTEPAYAMTVHKSQGSEFDQVALVLPEYDTAVVSREWLYTGLTRARRGVSWFGLNPDVLRAAAMRRTDRMSGLAHHLETALNRGESIR